MKTKKLEKVDVDQLQDIRNKYAENNMQLGMISIDEYSLQQRLDQIKQTKDQLHSNYDELRSQEQKLILELEKKYGEGQINLDEQVFIPND